MDHALYLPFVFREKKFYETFDDFKTQDDQSLKFLGTKSVANNYDSHASNF